MSDQSIIYLAGLLALIGLMAYAVLGGADFGGGVWDLLARGPRRQQQREAIARAIGPVWEANHVWLIFVIVVLFTCFPRGYGPLNTALFVPLHLVLAGIMLRGAAFVFRGYGAKDKAGKWGAIFGGASLISPLLLGMSFGVLTSGEVRVDPSGVVRLTSAAPWLGAYPLICGLLALTTCAFLAAVYLIVETQDDLREDFRRRAILSGTVTAALAATTLLVAYYHAEWFFQRMLSWLVLPVLGAGMLMFAGSAVAVFGRMYRLARVLAAGQTILMLLGWGLAHREYFIYPDIAMNDAAGPLATIKFMLIAVPLGMLILIPSLWLMFKVFKSDLPGAPQD